LRQNKVLDKGVCIAASICFLQVSAYPSYGQAVQGATAATNAGSGVSPYYGKRPVKPSTAPPAPVNAVVNSGLESDGSQFLLPFQGKLGAQQLPAAQSNIATTSALHVRLREIVPTDIDYGSYGEAAEVANQGSTRGTAHRSFRDSANQNAYASSASSNTTANKETGFIGGFPGRARADRDNHKLAVKLYGVVSRDDQFGVRIDDLLAAALARNTKMKDINHSVAHFHSHKSKTFDGAKDSLDEAVEYKGFSRSMEAADVILDQNVKAKNADSADYMKQRYVDQLHPKIVARVMQIAMGVGLPDQERGKAMVTSGVKSLSEIVGEKQAKNTAAMLQDWAQHINVSEEIFQQQQWDVEGCKNKIDVATKIAMNSDPVVNEAIKKIRKYERSGVASKTVGAANVVACLAEIGAPGCAIPAGIEMMRGSMIQANGGSEPKKLLRELYLDKRIESRYRTINEESQLAITNYQLAVARHNATLLTCAESVLSQLVGPECIADVLDQSVLHPQPGHSSAVLEAGRDVVVR
jgi:hypothetical protein